jgi:hypothetical protein
MNCPNTKTRNAQKAAKITSMFFIALVPVVIGVYCDFGVE